MFSFCWQRAFKLFFHKKKYWVWFYSKHNFSTKVMWLCCNSSHWYHYILYHIIISAGEGNHCLLYSLAKQSQTNRNQSFKNVCHVRWRVSDLSYARSFACWRGLLVQFYQSSFENEISTQLFISVISSRLLFTELRRSVEQLASHPRCPAFLRTFVFKFTAFVEKLAPPMAPPPPQASASWGQKMLFNLLLQISALYI